VSQHAKPLYLQSKANTGKDRIVYLAWRGFIAKSEDIMVDGAFPKAIKRHGPEDKKKKIQD